MQLEVLWSLLLQADSEGPSLIFCAVTHTLYKSALMAHLEVSTDSRTPIDGAGAVVLSVVLKPYSPSAENKKTAHDGLWPFATPTAPAYPGRQISAASFTLFN